jgi:hypothetical protein
MKLLGLVLLLSGWGIVVAAVRLLHGGALCAFIGAGLAIEVLGLVLFAKAHMPVAKENG